VDEAAQLIEGSDSDLIEVTVSGGLLAVDHRAIRPAGNHAAGRGPRQGRLGEMRSSCKARRGPGWGSSVPP
jgi:hypothetical protein